MAFGTAALAALFSLLALCALITTQSTSSAADALDPLAKRQQPISSQTSYLKSSFSSTRDSALPGDTIGFIATVDNRSDSTLTNLSVTMAVSDGETLIYLQNSTVAQLREDGPVSALPQLNSRPTTIAATLEPGQRARIEWKMQVTECALRDRWINVIFEARTDEVAAPPLNKNHYILPHSNLLHAASKVDYRLDTSTPGPGAAVRHTVRVANTGFVTLTDISIRLQRSDRAARILPPVADDSRYVVISPRDGYSGPLQLAGTVDQRGIIAGRDGLSGLPVNVDPAWSNLTDGGFTLDKLKPGSVLAFSWTDYVAIGASIGAEAESSVAVSIAGSIRSRNSAKLTVSAPPNDLQIDIGPADLGRLDASYLPGEVVTMHVTIVNHTPRDQNSLVVRVDLPFALSYVTDSGSYGAHNYIAGNARRLPDDWIYTGYRLPLLAPGQKAMIAFKARVGEDTGPQDGVEVHAVLQRSSGQERHVTNRFRIVGASDISLRVVSVGTAFAGDEVEYLVRVRNTGQVGLEDVEIGFELTCGMGYVRDSIRFPSGGAFILGGGGAFLVGESDSLTESPTDGDYLVRWLGPMAPGEETDFALKMRIGGDVAPGQLVGPRFVTTASTVETAILQAVMDRQETEITVVEPLVTADEFETRVEEILDRIEGVANETKATAERTEGLAEDIRETGKNTADLVTQTGELANDIKANTEAIGDQTTTIEDTTEATLDTVVENLDPWDQSPGWILRLGGFAALASFVAGAVLPFTLWRAIAWLRERHRRQKNPYLAAPATPPAWRSPSQWWAAAVRASEPLVAALRRVRDWVDGLRRR